MLGALESNLNPKIAGFDRPAAQFQQRAKLSKSSKNGEFKNKNAPGACHGHRLFGPSPRETHVLRFVVWQGVCSVVFFFSLPQHSCTFSRRPLRRTGRSCPRPVDRAKPARASEARSARSMRALGHVRSGKRARQSGGSSTWTDDGAAHQAQPTHISTIETGRRSPQPAGGQCPLARSIDAARG